MFTTCSSILPSNNIIELTQPANEEDQINMTFSYYLESCAALQAPYMVLMGGSQCVCYDAEPQYMEDGTDDGRTTQLEVRAQLRALIIHFARLLRLWGARVWDWGQGLDSIPLAGAL